MSQQNIEMPTSGAKSRSLRENALNKTKKFASAIKQTADRLTSPSTSPTGAAATASTPVTVKRAKHLSPKPATPTPSKEASLIMEGGTAEGTSTLDVEWEEGGFTSPHLLVLDSEEDPKATPQANSGRASMMYLSPARGIEMDLATKEANKIFLQGKEALEQAGNMKRELRVTVHESLQGLYEAFLCISDSRGRHKCSLEKERSRHAQELQRVEQAHQRQIQALTKNWESRLNAATEGIWDTLKEVKGIRNWLGYETNEPFKTITRLESHFTTLQKYIKDLGQTSSSCQSDKEVSPKLDKMEVNLTNLVTKIGSMSIQIQTLHNRVDDLAQVKETVEEPPKYEEALEQLRKLDEKIKNLTTLNKEAIDRPMKEHSPNDLTRHLQPITEGLRTVSSEIKELREKEVPLSLQPVPNLQQDITIAEVKDSLAKIEKQVSGKAAGQLKVSPQTYSQVLRKPSPPKAANHTLIIGSNNPGHTGEKVLECVKAAIDLRTTGAKVDRVRKARNQKIVISCASKEDLNLVREKVKSREGLTVQEPKPNNPLVCIHNVLHSHSNKEIEDLLLAQNKHLLQNIDLSRETVTVRYRKRARNPHESHPVIELSPKLYGRFMQVEKVHLGFGRSTIVDQSPLVQCTRCLGYGHTKSLCKTEESACGYCSGNHPNRECPEKNKGKPPTCINCKKAKKEGEDLAHTAFSEECQERQKWDRIARSRVSYC